MAQRKKVELPNQEKGIVCPECGAKQMRSRSKWEVIGGNRRRRECQRCGYTMYTTEWNDWFPPSERNGD